MNATYILRDPRNSHIFRAPILASSERSSEVVGSRRWSVAAVLEARTASAAAGGSRPSLSLRQSSLHSVTLNELCA